MAKMNFKDALNKSLQAAKKYVDDRIAEETEEETFNKLLEAGLILGSVELEDGSMLTDNDGNSIIF